MWYVLGIIVLVIVFVLLLNIRLTVSYNKETKNVITLKIGFIKITIYPQKEKKPKKPKPEKREKANNKPDDKTPENKKENECTKEPESTKECENTKAKATKTTKFAEKETEKKSKKISVTFSTILKIISFVRYRLTIYDIRINMNIGINDAANTAILCGGLYANIYEGIGLLQNMVFVNPPLITITPAYNELKLEAEYYISVKIRILSAIIILLKTLRLLKKEDK
ncbi:MAG: DUF2953 domain-containing protein [Clostridia bacterium]